jgi:hypothetical protein
MTWAAEVISGPSIWGMRPLPGRERSVAWIDADVEAGKRGVISGINVLWRLWFRR